MNIYVAVTSKKPYKRAGWDDWMTGDLKDARIFTTGDLLAQDWVVKDDGVILTLHSYWSAVAEVLKEYPTAPNDILLAKLATKLGL